MHTDRKSLKQREQLEGYLNEQLRERRTKETGDGSGNTSFGGGPGGVENAAETLAIIALVRLCIEICPSAPLAPVVMAGTGAGAMKPSGPRKLPGNHLAAVLPGAKKSWPTEVKSR